MGASGIQAPRLDNAKRQRHSIGRIVGTRWHEGAGWRSTPEAMEVLLNGGRLVAGLQSLVRHCHRAFCVFAGDA